MITSDYPAKTPSYVQKGFSLIVLVSRNGGKTWFNPVDISSCPDCGQEHSSYITTGTNGRVDAVWYDTRNWNGTDINAVDFDLYYANSTNGGQSFHPNIRVSGKSATKITNCPSQTPCGNRQLYEYIGLVSDDHRVMPVWATVLNGRVTPAFATIWVK